MVNILNYSQGEGIPNYFLDIEIAFDRVEWVFSENTFAKMSFWSKFDGASTQHLQLQMGTPHRKSQLREELGKNAPITNSVQASN